MRATLMTGAVAVVLIHSPVAQELGQPQGGQHEQEQQGRSLRPLDVVGREVLNSDGEAIGEIEAVVTDRTPIAYAVISVGRLLGLVDKEVALPIDRLRRGAGGEITTAITKEQLEGLPAFDEEQYLPLVPQ